MVHSTHFFALRAQSIHLDSPSIVANALEWLNLNAPERSGKLSELVSRICRGRIPDNCEPDWYDAMFALAMGNFEHIELESLVGLPSRDVIVEEAGILLPALRLPLPFPIPMSRELYPCIGHFPNQSLIDFQFTAGGKLAERDFQSLESDLETVLRDKGLPAPQSRAHSRLRKKSPPERVAMIQEEFAYTIESLVGDQMDLLVFFY